MIVTACMARGPLFQRASAVENFQRAVAGAVDIRSALFAPKEFFYPSMNTYFKRALLNMSVDAIPYDMGNIPCANGCKTLLRVRHVHQERVKWHFGLPDPAL